MTAALSMHTHPPPFPVVCSCPISFRVASSNFSAASVVTTTASARSSMDWLVVFVAVGKSSESTSTGGDSIAVEGAADVVGEACEV